jgi:MATE family multidrug resistance protein
LFPKTIFSLIGHSPEVQILESEYWVYLTLGGIFPVAQGAVAGFFSGRGKTYPIMWSTFAATAVNIVLNYLLIFGNLGMPEMGISGAGLSTFISGMLNFLILSILVFSNENNSKYKTRTGWKYDPALFKRLIRYGLPNGIQFFLDIAAFSLFILLIGRLGATELAAASIAFNVSMLAFMPMIGLGITASILTLNAILAAANSVAPSLPINNMNNENAAMSRKN